ncbi:2-polyprenyl-6-methoxyphenol hydroxylase [Nitrosospira briensis]|uniref:2-polyprenyl-6-methoxyphenol hydroxylase n=1 Tax=Nitrosospira briensis TaxID=35799 RepID=A0A1I4XCV5_9PROT|nr:FAD-dependent oxidoreductase [Nitrosospira briensis]SFN23734.1 2-polyprenyl-6-methoxyphenol hydroxylase [Nitrosospira briensis]
MAAISVQCCIAGGGPAGMMLGLLLARAGIEVLVLEKHADFLRDFRGDTIHPSTLEVMHELGLLEALLKLPHQKTPRINARFGNLALTVADFTHLKTRCPFVVLMPQWDFLNLLAGRAGRYPTFKLRMNAEVTEFIREDGHIVGLQAATPEGPLTVRAMLIIGADGRHSVVRAQAGLKGVDFGAPMDVLWFRLSRRQDDPADPVARFDTRGIFIMLNRGAYWQCGFVIPKGSHAQVKACGLPSLHESIAQLAPFISDRAGELRDWESIKLLAVQVDRLRQWYRRGVLCIGDAAHAMSPVGGVGINLAIQDAIAAANLLAAPLRENRVTDKDLHGVQQRRAWPTKMTQLLQLFLQKRVIGRVLHGKGVSPPFFFRLLARFPFLGWIPARLIGIGFRPEHVHTPDVWNDRRSPRGERANYH